MKLETGKHEAMIASSMFSHRITVSKSCSMMPLTGLLVSLTVMLIRGGGYLDQLEIILRMRRLQILSDKK